MKLYLIVNQGKNLKTMELLTRACEERGIDWEIIDPATVNPLKVKIESGDALYRVATRENYGAVELEESLIRPDIATFRTNSAPMAVRGVDKPSSYQFLGIAAPKTVGYLPEDHEVLLAVVEELGGFPIILKAMGGSHGVGVMRVDSPESLFSVGDFARKCGGEVVLKEYCDVTSTARLIVLGDRVISSIEYSAPEGDFRSNEGSTPNVSAKQFDEAVNKLAVYATNAQGLEFGGVDIMLTNDGPKVAEVNCPCYFPRCQLLTGDDIAGQMVDYLRAKSEKILASMNS